MFTFNVVPSVVQVILSELYSTGFQRSFSDDDDLTAIADSDVVYAFQAPPNSSRGGSVPHSGNPGNILYKPIYLCTDLANLFIHHFFFFPLSFIPLINFQSQLMIISIDVFFLLLSLSPFLRLLCFLKAHNLLWR